MRRSLSQIGVVGFLVLAWVGSASAFQVCLGLSNFGNKYKLEVTQQGNFLQLTGSERAFGDFAVSGAAFAGTSDYRLGFTRFSNNGSSSSDVLFNASLSQGTLSGPYTAHRPTFGDDISGTMSVISCSGVLNAEGLPDIAAR